MKNNIIKLMFCLLAIVLFTACKNFLNEDPKSDFTHDGAGEGTKYQNLSDASAALEGAYNSFKRDIFQLENYSVNDIQSDNCYAGSDGIIDEDVDLLKLTASNFKVALVWEQYLGMAGSATTVIENTKLMPTNTINDSDKARIIAEAKFIRAWAYFDMVRLWGDVPMMLKLLPTLTGENLEELLPEIFRPRSPQEEVYAQILSDLDENETIKHLDSKGSGAFKATKGAAYALLAKVTATQGAKSTRDYNKVISYCDKVLAEGYGLVANFDDLWKADNKFTKESIFEVLYTAEQPNWAYWVLLKEDDGTVTWRRYCTPTHEFITKFDKEKDTRYASSIIWKPAPYEVHYPKANYPFSYKIREKSSNIILMRLADILLLKAEALVELNKSTEAINIVNQIRERAGLGASSLKNTMPQAEARLAVEKERQLELYMEAQRWYDLLRNERMLDVMKAHKDKDGKIMFGDLQSFRIKWPVPQNERDMNKFLTQNEGY